MNLIAATAEDYPDAFSQAYGAKHLGDQVEIFESTSGQQNLAVCKQLQLFQYAENSAMNFRN